MIDFKTLIHIPLNTTVRSWGNILYASMFIAWHIIIWITFKTAQGAVKTACNENSIGVRAAQLWNIPPREVKEAPFLINAWVQLPGHSSNSWIHHEKQQLSSRVELHSEVVAVAIGPLRQTSWCPAERTTKVNFTTLLYQHKFEDSSDVLTKISNPD